MTAASSPSDQNRAERRMVSLRLTGEARAILTRLAQVQGVSQASVVELLLRHAAQHWPERRHPEHNQRARTEGTSGTHTPGN